VSGVCSSSALGGKINQNEINYAKQTQFRTKSNFYKPNKNKVLQRKIEIGHLVKTNPNEPKCRKAWLAPRTQFLVSRSDLFYAQHRLE
jgi:hypothetical protein